MGELKTNHQIAGVAVAVFVSGQQTLAQLGQPGLVLCADDQLVGIGASIGSDRHGLASVDELCAALTKSAPSAHDLLGDAARIRAVPTLHRLNGKAVSYDFSVNANS